LNHFATAKFWDCYDRLPESVRKQADGQYDLLKHDPRHPSLHFKKIGERFWPVRVGLHYRALAVQRGDDCVWFWIGSHAEYDKLIR